MEDNISDELSTNAKFDISGISITRLFIRITFLHIYYISNKY